MRLIDADALIAEIKNAYDWESLNDVSAMTIRDTITDIQNMPTIEAEPVKTGKWVEVYGGYHCSECGIVIDKAINTPHCPNCGAKMDNT